jgi:FkbM family methyltransferase
MRSGTSVPSGLKVKSNGGKRPRATRDVPAIIPASLETRHEFRPGITSYAQNFEDVVLWRALGHIQNGFYLDIGAQDPVIDSVSLAFHEKGWRGIHVEPVPHYANLLREHRPGDTIVQAVVSDAHALATFYQIADTGISTADAHIAAQHRRHGFEVVETSVPSVTLAALFELCGEREIQWLKIDVEGFERQVLSSWGDAPARPWVVVVESTLPLTQIQSYADWESVLLGYGYSLAYFDGLNRFYVSSRHRELLATFEAPPNVFDGFALSGTGTSPFHSRIKANYEEKLADAGRKFQQFKEESDRQVGDLSFRLTASKEIQTQQQHAGVLLEQRLTEQVQSAARKVEDVLQHQSQRERDWGEKLAWMQERSASASEELVRRYEAQLLDLTRIQSEREQWLQAEVAERRKRSELDKASAEIEHRNRIAELQKNLAEREEALAKQFAAAESELSVWRDREKILARQLLASGEAISQGLVRESKLADQLSGSQNELSQAQTRLAITQVELSEARAAVLQLQAAVSDREHELSVAGERADELALEKDSQLASAQAELSEARAAVLQLQDAVSEREHELSVAGERADGLALEKDRQLGSAQAELSQAQSRLSAAQAELSEVRIAVLQLQGAVTQLEQDLLAARQHAAEVTREKDMHLSGAKAELSQVRDALSQLKAAASLLEQDLSDARRQADALALERDKLAATSDARLRAAHDRAQALTRSLEASERAVTAMRGSLAWRLTSPLRAFGSFFAQTDSPGGFARTPRARPAPTHSQSELGEVQALLRLPDRDFLDTAYALILNRRPDAGGLDYYLGQLGRGARKENVLRQILESQEALSAGIHLPDLRGILFPTESRSTFGRYLKRLIHGGRNTAPASVASDSPATYQHVPRDPLPLPVPTVPDNRTFAFEETLSDQTAETTGPEEWEPKSVEQASNSFDARPDPATLTSIPQQPVFTGSLMAQPLALLPGDPDSVLDQLALLVAASEEARHLSHRKGELTT